MRHHSGGDRDATSPPSRGPSTTILQGGGGSGSGHERSPANVQSHSATTSILDHVARGDDPGGSGGGGTPQPPSESGSLGWIRPPSALSLRPPSALSMASGLRPLSSLSVAGGGLATAPRPLSALSNQAGGGSVAAPPSVILSSAGANSAIAILQQSYVEHTLSRVFLTFVSSMFVSRARFPFS